MVSFHRTCILTIALFSITLTSISSLPAPEKSGGIRKWRRESEPLDPENKYILSWEVDLDAETITFDAVVETTGYIGFGISPIGAMLGADIFMAGINSTFHYYAHDMHGIGNQRPIEDDHNDWNLLSVSENATHTTIKFSRLLNTCDNQDYPITEDTTRIIWSYGLIDDIAYHGGSRGTTSLNLIAPPTPEFDSSAYNRWEISVNTTMASMDTSYFCTIHKSNFLRPNHIVAFGAVLENMDAKKHTHHFTLSACDVPEGENLEPFLYPNYKGHECYVNENPIPYYLCSRIVYVWAVGGKMTIFPENLGYSTGTGETYYMLEVHYDNPNEEVDKSFKTGLEIYHTENLRETEVGIFIPTHQANPTLIVPPNTSDFVITSQCPSACTAVGFPNGVSVFNVLLHSHLSGRKMKFRQFRQGKELPWILSDNHYDFNFQQNKQLRQEVRILPGDSLRVECTYDTNWKNGEIVSGGLKSRDEMCEAIFYYYPRVEMNFCSGSYTLDQGMKDIGVTNYTINGDSFGPVLKATIHAPPELAGDYIDVLNTKFNWTPEIIAEMREKRKYGDQEYYCSTSTDNLSGISKYPVYDEDYVPEDKCAQK